MDSEKKNEIINAIRAAQQEFSGWDWTHDPGGCSCNQGTTPATTEPMCYTQLRAIGHTPGCSARLRAAQKTYAMAADQAASRASDLGDSAIALLESGKNDEARELIESACAAESEFGDCPSWGAVRRLFEVTK